MAFWKATLLCLLFFLPNGHGRSSSEPIKNAISFNIVHPALEGNVQRLTQRAEKLRFFKCLFIDDLHVNYGHLQFFDREACSLCYGEDSSGSFNAGGKPYIPGAADHKQQDSHGYMPSTPELFGISTFKKRKHYKAPFISYKTSLVTPVYHYLSSLTCQLPPCRNDIVTLLHAYRC